MQNYTESSLLPQWLTVIFAVVVQALSHDQLFATRELPHARLLCPSLSPRVCSNSCSLSWWCIQPSHPLASLSPPGLNLSQHQVFFPMSRLFTSGSHSIGASASVLPMNIQDWFPLGLTSLISLQSEGLSGVFSSTTIWKHQFFGTLPSLWSNSHNHT